MDLLGGRYRLVERLGGGGMSVVWRAHDEVLDRPVAVKVLAPGGSREWIRTEAQAAARLSHPHITGVHDYGEARTASGERLPYVVMELVNGPTLAQRLAKGRLPVGTALLVGAQIAAALAAAHARGLVHRDVKPGNVLLSPAGAKVVDFGIAAVAGARADSPSEGIVWGTPAYLAPERLAGGEVVPATDVYALGLILYRLLADAMPWPMDTVSQMLKAHRYQEPAPLPALPQLPDEVAEICHRCLAKAPGDRPTAADVARVLAHASGWPLTSEPADDEIVVGAGLPSGDEDTRLVPGPAAAVGRAAVGRAVSVPAKERHRAVSAALVLLALVLLVGYCGVGGPAQSDAATPDAVASPSGAVGPTGGAPVPACGAAAPAPAAVAAGGTGAGGQPAPPPPAATGGGGPGPGSGSGHGGPGPGPGPTHGGGAPQPIDRTITTPGGTVTARCVGPTATLVSWDPLPGFTPTEVNRGPGPSVGLVLHALVRDVHVGFSCSNGQPVPSVS